jgi:hypothetical protein
MVLEIKKATVPTVAFLISVENQAAMTGTPR